MFTNKRYQTPGIAKTLSPEVIQFLFTLIDNLKSRSALDYLQVFSLSGPKHTQIITHTMEDPEYCKVHSYYSATPINNIKVFIIDDSYHTTAMLAEEYWSCLVGSNLPMITTLIL